MWWFALFLLSRSPGPALYRIRRLDSNPESRQKKRLQRHPLGCIFLSLLLLFVYLFIYCTGIPLVVFLCVNVCVCVCLFVCVCVCFFERVSAWAQACSLPKNRGHTRCSLLFFFSRHLNVAPLPISLSTLYLSDRFADSLTYRWLDRLGGTTWLCFVKTLSTIFACRNAPRPSKVLV